jgi:RNA recognition motif-containing protein
MTNIFVGNLDITATAQQLRELFAAHGTVESVTIVKDRDTIAAKAAIAALDGNDLNGRPMRVNEARPKRHRDPARNSGTRDHRRHKM